MEVALIQIRATPRFNDPLSIGIYPIECIHISVVRQTAFT